MTETTPTKPEQKTNERPRFRRSGGKPQFAAKVDEFKDQVIDLRRVTRVTKGGKRMRFRATLVIGNNKGKVGIGTAKGVDVMEAITKAKFQAKKNVIEVKMKKKTIPHRVEAKYGAAEVLIKPAEDGHGLMAGGAPRVVLSLAGISDITAKCIGRTTNKLTNAVATIEALKKLSKVKKAPNKGENSEEKDNKSK